MPGKGFQLPHPAVADHQIGLSLQDRLNEPDHILSPVLVVGIGIHDHLGAQGKGGLQTGHIGLGQALCAFSA